MHKFIHICSMIKKLIQSSGKDAEKDIEEHFAWCMNALAERKAVLLRETAQTVENKSTALHPLLYFLLSLYC